MSGTDNREKGERPSERCVGFEDLAEALLQAGAVAVGAVRADRTDPSDERFFREWMGQGMNAGMDYMDNWPALRRDPREMHPGTRWIVSCAFPYPGHPSGAPYIASYALGDDYHKVIPKRVRKALRELPEGFSEATRICVDSAPVRERYWAVRSGIAERCDSGLVSVSGFGTRIFLTELLTTWDLTASEGESPMAVMTETGAGPGSSRCDHCGACRRACPGKAIGENGRVDARRCLCYLTIEHRGPWTEEQKEIMDTPEGRASIFGCDICQRVCHLNRNLPASGPEEFLPRPELLALTPEKVRQLTPGSFSRLTRNSPIRRTGLEGLLRNVRADRLPADE